MILYCDTSALVKRYVDESGSERVNELWDSASAVATSAVAFAEAISAFSRKCREGVLSDKEYKKILGKFKKDYEQLILVPLNKELNMSIEAVLQRYPLRGFDAIHLASALVFLHSDMPKLIFACFDSSLNRSAINEGLVIGITR